MKRCSMPALAAFVVATGFSAGNYVQALPADQLLEGRLNQRDLLEQKVPDSELEHFRKDKRSDREHRYLPGRPTCCDEGCPLHSTLKGLEYPEPLHRWPWDENKIHPRPWDDTHELET